MDGINRFQGQEVTEYANRPKANERVKREKTRLVCDRVVYSVRQEIPMSPSSVGNGAVTHEKALWTARKGLKAGLEWRRGLDIFGFVLLFLFKFLFLMLFHNWLLHHVYKNQGPLDCRQLEPKKNQ